MIEILYNKKTLAKHLNIAENTARTKIQEIRNHFKTLGKTLVCPSGTITDTMLYLYDETSVSLERYAELQRSDALNKLAEEQSETNRLLRELIEQQKSH